MPWQMRDPFNDALSAGIGAAGAIKKARSDAEAAESAAARQARLDQVDAALKGAQTAKYFEEAAGAKVNTENATTKLNIEKKASGYGLGAPPVVAKGASVKDQLANAVAAYQYYSQNGATELSRQALTAMNELRTQLHQIGQDALELRKQVTAELNAKAQREHWSAADKNIATANADKLLIAAEHDQTTIQTAQIHSAAIVQAASIGASSRAAIENSRAIHADQLETKRESGAMKRTRLIQGALDSRADTRSQNTAELVGAGIQATNPNAGAVKIPVHRIGKSANAAAVSPAAAKVPGDLRSTIRNILSHGKTSVQQVLQSHELQKYRLSPSDIQSIVDAEDDE